MGNAVALPDLTDPSRYWHWTDVTIRFNDEDRLGHINNATYVTWLEAGRVDLIYGFIDDPKEIDTVLARIEVDFIAETTFPGTVRIGGCLLALGNRSFRTGWGVFRDGNCLATAVCVNVFFDPARRQSMSPPERVRRAMAGRLAAQT